MNDDTWWDKFDVYDFGSDSLFFLSHVILLNQYMITSCVIPVIIEQTQLEFQEKTQKAEGEEDDGGHLSSESAL